MTGAEHLAEYKRILFDRGWCVEAGDHLVAYYRAVDAGEGSCVEGVNGGAGSAHGEGGVTVSSLIPSAERPPVAPPAGGGRTAARLAGPGRDPSAYPGTN